MSEETYTSRELDHMFNDIKETLNRIEKQTTKTNGRVTLLERTLLVVAAITGTVAVIYFPQIISAIKLFI